MSSDICPRCKKKGPILLRHDEVCETCRSAQVWARFGKGNQIIVIKAQAETRPTANPDVKPLPRPGPAIWSLLILSLALTAIGFASLVFFFRNPPAKLSLDQFLNRFNDLASAAAVLGAFAFLISTGTSFFGINKRAASKVFRIWGVTLIGLALMVFASGLFCWYRTERVHTLVPPQSGSANSLAQRLYEATTVIYAFNQRSNRYRPATGAGVIIAGRPGRTSILTVPYAQGDSWRDLTNSESLLVSFSDGRLMPGALRWAATPPMNLALIEVETNAAGSAIQFHPIAEAIIPSAEVLVVLNPLEIGWKVERGMILKRRQLRTVSGWSCLVDTDINSQRASVGSGMYDLSGRLLGLNAGYQRNGTAQFVVVSSDFIKSVVATLETESSMKEQTR